MQGGNTPLCVAVESGTVNTVETLIQHGASVTQQAEVSNSINYKEKGGMV